MSKDTREGILSILFLAFMVAFILGAGIALVFYLNEMFAYGEEVLRQMGAARY